jgi:phospholipid/cholesterol/gamma-HCH transport system substrate-binding protein
LAIQNDQGPTDQEIEQAVPQQAGRRDVRIGLFVLMGIVATTILLYMLTDPAMFRGRYKVTTSVENVMGLRKGDPVQMRGVNIGRVHDFDLARDAGDVLVVLEVEGQWQIPVGSVTQLVSPGLMSPKTVMVVPGPGPGAVPAGTLLPGTAMKGLLDDTDSLGEKGELFLDQMTTLLSDSMIASVGGSAKDLQVLLGEMADVMGSQSDEIKDLIGSLNRAADGLADATGPELRDDIASTVAQADSLMGSLGATSVRFDRAAASLETVLGRMERGEGTLGQLSVNDSLYVNLSAAVESVRLLMDDLRANPGRYINLSIF